jgi:DNA-binding NarL/FixJ family response regulator
VTIRVFIVDDHELFRSGVRNELGRNLEIVGDAGTVEEAVPAIVDLRPDVVLLDVQLPGRDGFAVADAVTAEPSAPAVVLVSSRGRHAYRAKLAATRARGSFTKEEFSGECLTSLLR